MIKTVCNNKVTRCIYDANGKLVQKVYPGQYNQANDGWTGTSPVNTYSDNTVGDRYTYDAFGNTQTYTDSNNRVTTNTYDSNNNLIKSVCDDKVTRYIYNAKGQLTQKVNPEQYNASDDGLNNTPSENTYSDSNVGDRYTYDANGKVLTHIDSYNKTTSYTYDNDGNLLTETLPNGAVFSYDNKTGKVNSETYAGGTTYTTNYNDDNSVNNITGNNGVKTQYGLDSNGNLSNYTLTAGSNVKSSAYTYDGSGNILSVSESGTQKVKYTYGLSNQVTREDNVWLNETITYTYDTDGNITAKKVYSYTTGDLTSVTPTKTYSYLYGNTSDSDQLTSYDGKAIGYDSNGNVLTYNGWTFTWQDNQLATALNGSNNNSYQYYASGIRKSKTVNGVTTNFTIDDNNNVVSQTNGTDTINFAYDSNGEPASMTLNGTTYTYERNLQGDIIGLLDSSNNEVVTYSYDTWGKVQNIGGSLANTIGLKNPLRYRGYYYDTETGLYYLQSRYYNPEWGRFISRDDPSYEEGQSGAAANLYAYCGNNPVVNCDPSGQYNRTNAINYASKWYSLDNPLWKHFKSDCAKFVSECLSAGGIKMTFQWYCRHNFWYNFYTGIPYLQDKLGWDWISSWSEVIPQYNYFKGSKYCKRVVTFHYKKDLQKANTYGIKAGDLMYMDNEGKGNLTHAVIVTGTKKGDVLYCGHNNARAPGTSISDKFYGNKKNDKSKWHGDGKSHLLVVVELYDTAS